MGIVINQFAPLTNRITASVLDSMWEGVVMAAVAWLLLEVIKRLNAATRFVIWSGVMVCVGTLSGIAVVNGFQTKRLSPSATGSVQNRASDLAFPSANELALANGLETQRGSESQTQSILLGESRLVHLVHQAPAVPRVLTIEGGWSVFFIAVWALVTPFLLGKLALSFVHLKKLKRAAVPFDDACQNRFRLLLRNAGISRSIRFRHSNSVSVPVALGLSNPVVLIPRELLNQLEESELEQIVLHEAAHLARRDDWSKSS